MSIRYELYVKGTTWGGFKASYTYQLKGPITCAADAAKIAEDFESLSYWRCYSIKIISESSGSTGRQATRQ